MAILLDGTVGITTPSITNTGVETISGVTTIQGITVGRGAGAVATNTAVGASALANMTSSGFFDVAIGYNALYTSTGGIANNAIGYRAMYATTTGANSQALGASALAANTTGSFLVAIGDSALAANTTGNNSVAIGQSALAANTTASNNVAIGYQAGYSGTTNGYNVFVGYQAGYSANRTADIYGFNTFVGWGAGYNATTGQANTFIGCQSGGYGAGNLITTGSKNTIIGGYNGNQGGLDIRTASNYIVLSDGDGNPQGIFDPSGNFLIGTKVAQGTGITLYKTSGNATAPGLITFNGASSATEACLQFLYNGSQVGTVTRSTTATAYNTSSDYRLKENVTPMTGALAKVTALKPVTYKWKMDGSDGEGFIAHELAEVVPQCVTGEKDEVDAEGKPIYQGIDTSFLVATLTAAIQELKAEIDQLKSQQEVTT